jgi:small subunit ribosomal protein S20
MPNIASAKKRVRTTAKRTAINTAKAAEPEIMRGVSKGVLHKNTGSRKVSRLTKRVAKLS